MAVRCLVAIDLVFVKQLIGGAVMGCSGCGWEVHQCKATAIATVWGAPYPGGSIPAPRDDQ